MHLGLQLLCKAPDMGADTRMDLNRSPTKRHPAHPAQPMDTQQYYQQPHQPIQQPIPPQQQPYQPQYGSFGQPAAPSYGQYGHMSPPPTGPYAAPQATDAGASFFGSALPTAQIGLHFGNQALAAGTDYMSKNMDKLVPKQKLKAYFNVTNSYVLQKLILLAFPFRHKSWQRIPAQQTPDGRTESYATPRDDVNAPDLYIPSMAFVTFVLMSGLVAGLQGRFHPKVLGETASMIAILSFLQWGAVKLGLYLLNIGVDLSSLDILALIGYNYVGILGAITASLLIGSYGKWAVFAYNSITTFFFVMRSLRQVFLPDATETLVITQRRRRVNFLFGIVCLQVATSLLMLLFK